MENSENLEKEAEALTGNTISTAVLTSISLDFSDNYLNGINQEFETPLQSETTEIEAAEVVVESIENILKSWNMYEALGQLFREHQMDLECLVNIKESDVDNLLPIFGIRIKFKNYLIRWRIVNGYPAIPDSEMLSVATNIFGSRSNSTPLSTSLSPSTPIPPEEKCVTFETKNLASLNLREILEGDYLAAAAISYQQKEKCINDLHRRDIIAAIVNYFIQNKIRLAADDFNIITNKIIEIFTTENKVSYFIERTESSQPRGSLYNKYINTVRKFRSQGLAMPYNKKYKTRLPCETEEIHYINDDKFWLVYKHEPWVAVEEHWKATINQRHAEIHNSKETNISTILKEWPRYKDRDGHRLIEIDFEALYKDCVSKLFTNFDLKSLKILQLDKTIKIKRLQSFIESNSKDLQHLQLFKILHYLLPPLTRHKLKVADKVIHWKPSIQDSINGMFLFVENEASINEEISNLREEHLAKKLTLQPIIIVVMIQELPIKFFVRLDDATYIQHTILGAIDLCFKSFQVFNLAYPHQSQNVWYFIQTYFYGINTHYDKPVSAVANLITQLSLN